MRTHPKAIESMRDALLRFSAEAAAEGPPPRQISLPDAEWHLFGADDYILAYRRPETHEALTKLETKFTENKVWASKWSREALLRACNRAIAVSMKNPTPERVLEAMTQACTDLDRNPPVRIVLLAVSGVLVEGKDIHFDNVRLFTMSAQECEQLRGRLFAIIDGTNNTPEQRERFKADLERRLSSLAGQAIAEIRVSGDLDRAKRESSRILEPILDLAQLVSAIDEPRSKAIRVREGGIGSPLPTVRVISATDGAEASFDQDIPHEFRVKLSLSRLDKLRQDGFGAVLNALTKDEVDRTEFENVLIGAIHWVADAERQDLAENQVTSYVTALDMFFTSKDAPVTRDVSEGTALILGDTLDQRRVIKRDVTYYYGLRSQVSHVGQRTATERDVISLKRTVITTIAKMCSLGSRFSTKQELQEWIADLRLSAERHI